MFNVSYMLTRALLFSPVTHLKVIHPLRLFSTTTVASMGLPSPVAPNTPTAPDQGPPKIHLYTAGTPNGYKPSICLEELRAAYPDLAASKLSYDVYSLSFAEKQQKDPEFLKINPNGRIPAIVDDNAGGLAVFESAAVLEWLVEQYDPKHVLGFSDAKERAQMNAWIMFAQGGPGPMMGQLGVFLRTSPPNLFGIKRYADESERLLSVYEDALAKSDYLVAGRYSLADLNAWTWVSMTPPAVGIDLGKFPKVQAWVERISKRPGVQEGLKVPKQKVFPTEEERKQKLDELNKLRAEAEEA